MPKLLAMAIALVVGLGFGPTLAPASAPAPAVASFEEKVVDSDALKLGERLEPRVAPASALDRLLPRPAARRLTTVAIADVRMAAYARAPERRADEPRFQLPSKHVPRLERGDPPRI
jgi:hypothetical protein